MPKDASRTARTTFDHGFEVRFVERCYDGCERWYNREVWQHTSSVSDDPHRLLDREKTVRESVIDAHSAQLFYGDDSCFLLTCVNPACGLRAWKMIDFAAGIYTVVTSEDAPASDSLLRLPTLQKLKEDIREGFRTMAQGDWEDLKFQCPECGKKQPLFAIVSIHNKWIYVLQEAGQRLQPVSETFAESDVSGRTHLWQGDQFSKASFAYEGTLRIPKLVDETYHFFLSPVRLGPKALDLLCQSPQNQAHYDSSVPKANPQRYRVGVMPALQPWAATVKRRFTSRQFPTLYEYVPLVDPFAWAAVAKEVDYFRILDAQRDLATNENEQSKAFIAGTLQQAIRSAPAVPDAAGKAAGAENDRFGVEKTLVAPPGSSGASNIAEAWMKRYEAITEYLANEVNYASCRVFFSALFAPGHRIVEAACQERPDDPDFLQFGLLHWHHLLTDSLACPAGKEFVKSLVRSSALAERIPQASVLRCEGLGRKSKYIQKYRNAVPAQLFANLMPVLIATISDPPKTISEYFARAAREGYTPGDDEADLAEQAIDIPQGFVEHYFEKSMAQFAQGKLPATKADYSWRCLGVLKSWKALMTLWGLGVRWRKYRETGRDYEGKWEHFDAVRGAFFEMPAVGSKLALAWLKEATETKLNGLEFAGGGVILSEDAAIFKRLEHRLAFAGRASMFLSGPIGLVTAVLDLISESEQARDGAHSGDRGAVVGHGLEAAGALLSIAPCVAYTAAMLTGAEAVAWAGPVGLIAAGLIVAGAIVVHFCTLSDLAMFAKHCFLGQLYGGGEWDDKTGKRWMSGETWPWLRYDEEGSSTDSRHRFVRQRAVLLRIFCDFEIVVGTWQFAGGDILLGGWVPDGGIFQIKVTLRPAGESSPTKTYTANILPAARKYAWVGEEPGFGSQIAFHQSPEGKLQSIHVTAIPPFARTSLDAIFQVRLQLDTTGDFTIPARDWLERSTYRQGKAASAGVD